MQRLKETRRHSGNGSPETQFGYFDGRAPMFDTVPDKKQCITEIRVSSLLKIQRLTKNDDSEPDDREEV
jgi:hypothetical protein